MSNTNKNDADRNKRSGRERKRSTQHQAQATTANAEQSRVETPISFFAYDEDFPSFGAATSKQAAAANMPSSNQVYIVL